MHGNIGTAQIKNKQNEKLLGITIDSKQALIRIFNKSEVGQVLT